MYIRYMGSVLMLCRSRRKRDCDMSNLTRMNGGASPADGAPAMLLLPLPAPLCGDATTVSFQLAVDSPSLAVSTPLSISRFASARRACGSQPARQATTTTLPFGASTLI